MEVLQKMLHYLNPFAKRNPDAPHSFNLKFMHGINRLSIFMFLIAMLVLLVRNLTR